MAEMTDKELRYIAIGFFAFFLISLVSDLVVQWQVERAVEARLHEMQAEINSILGLMGH